MTTGAGTSGRDGGLNLQTAVTLLPTPLSGDHRGSWDGNGDTAGRPLCEVVHTLLPTPSASSYGTNQGGAAGRVGPVRESLDTMARHGRFDFWGKYEAAIRRWEKILGRVAPSPTQISPRNGRPQLSPAFAEWLMGLPRGWVCDVPGLTRNEMLSLIGDGVVPQQMIEGYRTLMQQHNRGIAA